MEAARHNFGNAVPVEVADGRGNEMRRRMRQNHGGEMLMSIVQPRHHRNRFGISPIVVVTDREKIDKSVTIQIGRTGTVSSGKVSDTVKDEVVLSSIFDPLDTVPRRRHGPRSIKTVAI